MSSDSTGSFRWSPDEQATLILFLVEEKCAGKLGEGGFKAATLNAAAAHLSSWHPNRSWTAQQCRNQITSVWIQCDPLICYWSIEHCNTAQNDMEGYQRLARVVRKALGQSKWSKDWVGIWQACLRRVSWSMSISLPFLTQILTVVNYRNVQVVRCLVLRQRGGSILKEWTRCFQVI